MGSGLFRCCCISCAECLEPKNWTLPKNFLSRFESGSEFEQLQRHFDIEAVTSDAEIGASWNQALSVANPPRTHKGFHLNRMFSRSNAICACQSSNVSDSLIYVETNGSVQLDIIPTVRCLNSYSKAHPAQTAVQTLPNCPLPTQQPTSFLPLHSSAIQTQELPILEHLAKNANCDRLDSSQWKLKTNFGNVQLNNLNDFAPPAFSRLSSEEHDESTTELAPYHLDPNDLEWDTYEEDTIVFHNDTEQLMREIDEIAQSLNLVTKQTEL